MNHQANPICDKCGELQSRFKDLKTLKEDGKKVYLCKYCYKERRLNFRNETIEVTGIKEEIKELERQMKNEYQKAAYEKKAIELTGKPPRKRRTKLEMQQDKNYIPKRYKKQSERKSIQESNSPIKIKGSNLNLNNKKINTYLTLDEKQNILKIFMSRGDTFEEAKEKIEKMKEQLKKTRQLLKEKDCNEDDLINSKNKLLEELYNS